MTKPDSQFSFFYVSCASRDLHSFPTRRSSDLSFAESFATLSCRIEKQSLSRRNRSSTTWGIRHERSFLKATAFRLDRKSTRLNSSHQIISYDEFRSKNKEA